jgi:hypothetical protein
VCVCVCVRVRVCVRVCVCVCARSSDGRVTHIPSRIFLNPAGIGCVWVFPCPRIRVAFCFSCLHSMVRNLKCPLRYLSLALGHTFDSQEYTQSVGCASFSLCVLTNYSTHSTMFIHTHTDAMDALYPTFWTLGMCVCGLFCLVSLLKCYFPTQLAPQQISSSLGASAQIQEQHGPLY